MKRNCGATLPEPNDFFAFLANMENHLFSFAACRHKRIWLMPLAVHPTSYYAFQHNINKIKPPAGDEAAGGKGVKTRMESL